MNIHHGIGWVKEGEGWRSAHPGEYVARIEQLEAALTEIHRRTGLLLMQNTGRWDSTLEHDCRTMGVLNVNQEIASEALSRHSVNSEAK
jgi:hypothetical protein